MKIIYEKGDKVLTTGNSVWGLHVMTVESHTGVFVQCHHPKLGIGGFLASELAPSNAVPARLVEVSRLLGLLQLAHQYLETKNKMEELSIQLFGRITDIRSLPPQLFY